jgi:hypothetical protein
MEEAAFPAEVLGPEDLRARRRLAAVFLFDVIGLPCFFQTNLRGELAAGKGRRMAPRYQCPEVG